MNDIHTWPFQPVTKPATNVDQMEPGTDPNECFFEPDQDPAIPGMGEDSVVLWYPTEGASSFRTNVLCLVAGVELAGDVIRTEYYTQPLALVQDFTDTDPGPKGTAIGGICNQVAS